MNTKMLFLGCLLGLLLFTNCSKDNEGLFDIPIQVDFAVPAGLNVFDTHYLVINNIPNNVAALISQNGLAEEDVNSINPKTATITALLSNQTYEVFREVSVEIFPTGSNPDRSSLEAFYREQIPLNAGDNLDLLGTLIDAKSYLLNDEFSLRIRMEMRDLSPRVLESRLNLTFVVR